MTKSPPGKGANISQRAKSLAAYAKANPQHHNGRCWMCNIPERDEVHAYCEALATDGQKRKGIPVRSIFLWLRDECGYAGTATYGKVHNHFQNNHHERTQ